MLSELETKTLTCQYCYHQGEDVSVQWVYAGGIGDIRVVQCDDRAACWRRWDEIYSAEVELENQIEIVSVIRGA